MCSGQAFVDHNQKDGDDLFSHIVMFDETGISQTNVESKQESMQLRGIQVHQNRKKISVLESKKVGYHFFGTIRVGWFHEMCINSYSWCVLWNAYRTERYNPKLTKHGDRFKVFGGKNYFIVFFDFESCIFIEATAFCEISLYFSTKI